MGLRETKIHRGGHERLGISATEDRWDGDGGGVWDLCMAGRAAEMRTPFLELAKSTAPLPRELHHGGVETWNWVPQRFKRIFHKLWEYPADRHSSPINGVENLLQ